MMMIFMQNSKAHITLFRNIIMAEGCDKNIVEYNMLQINSETNYGTGWKNWKNIKNSTQIGTDNIAYFKTIQIKSHNYLSDDDVDK